MTLIPSLILAMLTTPSHKWTVYDSLPYRSFEGTLDFALGVDLEKRVVNWISKGKYKEAESILVSVVRPKVASRSQFVCRRYLPVVWFNLGKYQKVVDYAGFYQINSPQAYFAYEDSVRILKGDHAVHVVRDSYMSQVLGVGTPSEWVERTKLSQEGVFDLFRYFSEKDKAKKLVLLDKYSDKYPMNTAFYDEYEMLLWPNHGQVVSPKVVKLYNEGGPEARRFVKEHLLYYIRLENDVAYVKKFPYVLPENMKKG